MGKCHPLSIVPYGTDIALLTGRSFNNLQGDKVKSYLRAHSELELGRGEFTQGQFRVI